MGKGPGHGSCHQGWQDLRGQTVLAGGFLKRGRQRPVRACVPFLVYLPPLALQAPAFASSSSASRPPSLPTWLPRCWVLHHLAFLFLYATQYYQRLIG